MQICHSNFIYMSERKFTFKTLEAFLVRARNWDMNKKISLKKMHTQLFSNYINSSSLYLFQLEVVSFKRS